MGRFTDVKVDKVNGPVFEWKITNELGASKTRTVWKVGGIGTSIDYGVHNANFENVRRGIYERVLYRVAGINVHTPAVATAGVFEERMSSFRGKLVRTLPTFRPVTRDQFVEMYRGRRKAVYQRAAMSLSARPLNLSDSFLSTFVKCEKINFSAKEDPAPRVIQPRSPRYNVEVGRYLKQMESKICDGIAEIWGGATVMKGMNAEEVGGCMKEMWEAIDDVVAVDLDASRFDQHVSAQALEWEHSVYEALVDRHDRPKLGRLLAWQRRNRGYARTAEGCIVYEVLGRRMSGDMNTGMGNCLLMSAMMHAYCESIGITARLANNGDDCVVFLSRKDLERFRNGVTQYFLELGFVMEVGEVAEQLEKVKFCQTQPVYDGERWVMVRDPRVSIDKDLVSVLDLGTKNAAAKWAYAVGECGLALTGGFPIQEFYRCLLRSGKQGNVADHPWMDGGFMRMRQGRNTMSRVNALVRPETRASYWRAFGILPDMQEAMEEVWSETTLTFSAGVLVNQLYLIPNTY